MKVLITGAASRLGQAVAAELAPQHALRLMDENPVAQTEEIEVVQGSLLEPETVWQAVRGRREVRTCSCRRRSKPASGASCTAAP